MRVQKPRVSLLFQSAVDEIKSAGVELLPDDYVWLHDAARKAIDCCGSECPSFIQQPATIGDVVLWPMTLGAGIWWDRQGSQWYNESNETEVIAIAFCMAHAKQPEVFESLNSKTKADFALVKWQLGIASKCTINELAWAIDRVNNQCDYREIDSANEVKNDNYSATDWGSVIAKLCGAYHQPANHFLWEMSQQAVIDMLSNAPVPYGYEKEKDGQASKYFAQFREVVAHIKNRANKV